MRVLLFQRHAGYRFIPDFTEDFRAAGHTAEWLPPTEGPHLPRHIRRFAPDLVFCVGASPAVAKAVAGRVPCVFYELDKILNLSLWEAAPAGENDVVFTTYRDDIATFRRFGFRHVHYLPFCPNIARTPPAPPPAPAFGVAFVGSLVREATNDYHTLLRHGWAVLRDRPADLAQLKVLVAFLESVISTQARAFDASVFLVPALLRRDRPAEATAAMQRFRLPEETLVGIVAKEVASRQRLHWLEQLGAADLWGPESPAYLRVDWNYHGAVDQYHGCAAVFAAARANLNLQRLYARDGLSDRVFNVLFAGGCLLADANPALLELFEPDHEVAVFNTPEELRQQAERLTRDSTFRRKLAENGRRCIEARHLFRHRLGEMLLRLPGSAPRTTLRTAQSSPIPTRETIGSLPGARPAPALEPSNFN